MKKQTPPKPPSYYWFRMSDVFRKPKKAQRNYLRTRTPKAVIEAELPAWTHQHPTIGWLANRNLAFKAKVLRREVLHGVWLDMHSRKAARNALISEANRHFTSHREDTPPCKR